MAEIKPRVPTEEQEQITLFNWAEWISKLSLPGKGTWLSREVCRLRGIPGGAVAGERAAQCKPGLRHGVRYLQTRGKPRDFETEEQAVRKERCEQCGRVWGVSACASYYAGVYICPQCEAKNRRTEYEKVHTAGFGRKNRK